MKKLRVTIEGKTYDVLVEVLDEAIGSASAVAAQPIVAAPIVPVPAATRNTPPQSPAASGASPGDVVCPLTGKVVSIDVKLGDTLQEGTQVATVEAMKMNTYIYAPHPGKVTVVLVNIGDGVEEGTALLRIE